MCGIVGVFLKADILRRGRLTRDARQLIVHRGPDDAGKFIDGPARPRRTAASASSTLGGGHQPMQTADGRYVIVYNGEIYNYRELRAELEARGVQFPHALRHRSDPAAARAARGRGGRVG